MKVKQFFPWSAMTFTVMLGSMVCITSCSDDDDPTTDSTEASSTDGSSTTTATSYDYVQVGTGQTELYDKDGNVVSLLDTSDSCYGQDGTYIQGATMSFTNNGDGTVSDNNTGLMWEEIPSSDEFTWQEAVDYCNELELGGHSDWRMPSLKELFSISDFSSGWPYIDTNYFALASGEVTKDEQFWSSNFYVGTTVEGGNTAAFGVNHVTGHIKAYPAVMPDMGSGDAGDGSPNGTGEGEMPPPGTGDASGAPSGNPFGKFVRAVRGDEYGVNKFVDNGDGTVSDQASGLMWMQADNAEGLDWEAALAYAENATVAGYSDWRMPNVKELQGIVDYSYSVTAVDADKIGPAIDPIFSCTQITSEAGYDDYPYYWTSTSARFNTDGAYYYAWYVAAGRAVNGAGEDYHGAGAVRFDTKYEGGELGEGGERYYNYVRLVRNIN